MGGSVTEPVYLWLLPLIEPPMTPMKKLDVIE
jgi:hypothetical protein